MRHHNSNRKFSREAGQRRALLNSLARNLINKKKIKTTEAKAKELRSYVEKLVTKSRVDTLATRRLVASRLGGVREAKVLVETIAPNYKTRPGGYTRIVKLPPRLSDGSKMAIIEFV